MSTSTKFSVNQKGFTPLVIVILLAAALVGGYFVYTNYSNLSRVPAVSEVELKSRDNQTKITQPQPSPSPADEIANWKTYDAFQDGFIENEHENFSFKYPPDFTLDHATGPANTMNGGFSVILSTDGMSLDITTVPFGESTQDEANIYIKDILNAPNCDLFPSCNSNAFSTQEKTLSNSISASVVSGPDFDGDVFDLYFIQSHLSFRFSYKDRDKWKQTRDQILSTIKFLDQNQSPSP